MQTDLIKVEDIELHWMRHALSCANILKIFGMAGLSGYFKDPIKGITKLDPRSTYAADSKLSAYGIYDAKTVPFEIIRNKFILSDYLFGDDEKKVIITSNLKRTIETAIYTFGHLDNVTIIPVPFIGEQSNFAKKTYGLFEFDESNTPTTVSKLIEYFKDFFTKLDTINKGVESKKEFNEQFILSKPNLKISFDNIDWKYLKEEADQGHDPATQVSSTKFNKEILPRILKDYPDNKNFVVISHSNFIAARSKCKKINNLEIITEKRNYKYYRLQNGKIRAIVQIRWNCRPVNPMPNLKEIARDVILGTKKTPDDKIPLAYGNCFSSEKLFEALKKYANRNPVKMSGFVRTFLPN